MQCHQPIKSNDLILSEFSAQQEWDLSCNICLIKREAFRLKCLRHLHCLFSQVSYLSIFAFLLLFFLLLLLLEIILTLIDLDFCERLLLFLLALTILIQQRLGLVIHALLNETLCVQLLRHFHAQLQMLLHKVLKLLGACLLALLVKLHPVVVLNNFFDAAPEELHHL